MDRRDDGLVERLQLIEEVGQPRLLGRLAEFRDVGTGDERASLAENQHDLAGIDAASRDRVEDPLAHRLGQRIDRRIVDRNDTDVRPRGCN